MQIVTDFKEFITKFYPANQQQTFIYRQALSTAYTVCWVLLANRVCAGILQW